MKILGQLSASSEKFLATGREKLQTLRRDRHRRALLSELGHSYYEDRFGDGNGEAKVEIDRIIGESSLIDDAAADESGSDEASSQQELVDDTVDDETRALETV